MPFGIIPDLAFGFAGISMEDLGEIDLAGIGSVGHTLRLEFSGLGTGPEQPLNIIWLQLFDRYLPKRYRAAPTFAIDSTCREKSSRSPPDRTEKPNSFYAAEDISTCSIELKEALLAFHPERYTAVHRSVTRH